MSPEQQRIAIAEACGWRDISQGVGPNINLFLGDKPNQGSYLADQRVPDFLNDLNAMHEAETRSGMIIGPAEWDEYCLQLRIKIGRDIEAKGGPGSVAGLICLESAVSATAAQRAEAFLRTIGKWSAPSESLNQSAGEPYPRCTYKLQKKGEAYPRTCEECGLGPCKVNQSAGEGGTAR